MKRIILCADDYGQNDVISQAILNLIKKKRLTAVSCMVAGVDWARHAAMLAKVQDQIDVGLHVNLTEDSCGWPLSRLLVRSSLRLLKKQTIHALLVSQLDQFERMMGRLPDFIDGHQHVHQFPLVRDVLLSLYEKRLRRHGVYIRNVETPYKHWRRGAYLKHCVLKLSGSAALRKQLLWRGIPHNHSFSGIYDFSCRGSYRDQFEQFLKEIADGGLIMSHPGLAGNSAEDTIRASRIKEYQFFESDEFLHVCEKHQVTLARFHQLSHEI